MALREGPRDDDVRMRLRQFGAIGVRKSGIGFIDHEQTGECPSEFSDFDWRERHAQRSVRISKKENGRAALSHSRNVETKVVAHRHLHHGCPLGRGQHRIQRVARIQHANRTTRTSIGAN